jgi:hypothetical protein
MKKGFLVFCAFTGAAVGACALPPGAPPDPETRDIAAETVERTGLLPADIALLDQPAFKWRHLQTEHFVLHHDQKLFAAKVARMGEQFYDAISADLPSLQDRTAPARSHIFIFRDPQEWQAIVSEAPGMESWASSFVRGNAMYLQEIGTAPSEKMDALAHEMTHLVFNRFLPVRLPLWLNEGLAEYYGEFAYRAARGMGQGKNNAFRPLRNWTPLADLLTAATYPADPAEVGRFYTTCKYLTGFLLLKLPREKWDAFFARRLAGEPALPALLETYGWADIAALEKAFSQFAR